MRGLHGTPPRFSFARVDMLTGVLPFLALSKAGDYMPFGIVFSASVSSFIWLAFGSVHGKFAFLKLYTLVAALHGAA